MARSLLIAGWKFHCEGRLWSASRQKHGQTCLFKARRSDRRVPIPLPRRGTVVLAPWSTATRPPTTTTTRGFKTVPARNHPSRAAPTIPRRLPATRRRATATRRPIPPTIAIQRPATRPRAPPTPEKPTVAPTRRLRPNRNPPLPNPMAPSPLIPNRMTANRRRNHLPPTAPRPIKPV